jgi:hypothetical protein
VAGAGVGRSPSLPPRGEEKESKKVKIRNKEIKTEKE